METMTVRVRGIVQGVGFRYVTRDQLARLGLSGSAENLPDGSVRVTAQGSAEDLERLLAWLNGPGTPGLVHEVVVEEGPR